MSRRYRIVCYERGERGITGQWPAEKQETFGICIFCVLSVLSSDLNTCTLFFSSLNNFSNLRKHITSILVLPFPLEHSIKLRGSAWPIRWITRWRWSSDPTVSLPLSIFSSTLPRYPEGWLVYLDIVRVKANLIPAGWIHSRLCPSRRADHPLAVIAQQSSVSHPFFVPRPPGAGGRVLPAKLSRRRKPSPILAARRSGGKVKLILFRRCESKWINSAISNGRIFIKRSIK